MTAISGEDILDLHSMPLGSVSEAILQQLIDNAVSELRILDYKLEFRVSTDAEKKEFLADISSFANADGGDILVGVRENDSFPVDLVGMPKQDLEQLVLTLEQLAANGIRRRLPSLSFQAVPLKNGRCVLIARIGRSWDLPHMVTLKGSSRFYGRNSKGKYPLDVDQIRALSNLAGSEAQRLQEFRTARVAMLLRDAGPSSVGTGAVASLHVVPLSAIRGTNHYDLSKIPELNRVLQPMTAGQWDCRYNFDGFVCFGLGSTDGSRGGSYTLLFRDGKVEAASGALVGEQREQRIYTARIEAKIIETSRRILDLLKGIGASLPIALAVSILRVGGYSMTAHVASLLGIKSHPIDRDHLIIPEVIINDWTTPVDVVLRPAFDSIWQAGGYARSLNFDENTSRWKHPL